MKIPPNAPTAILVRFAEVGIDLELGVWIDDPDSNQINLRSSINQAIWKAFRENGIRVPVLPRDLRVVAPPAA